MVTKHGRYAWRILHVGADGLRNDRGLVIAPDREAALLQMRDRLTALRVPFDPDSVRIDGDRLTITFPDGGAGVDHVWQAVRGIKAPAPGERWGVAAKA